MKTEDNSPNEILEGEISLENLENLFNEEFSGEDISLEDEIKEEIVENTSTEEEEEASEEETTEEEDKSEEEEETTTVEEEEEVVETGTSVFERTKSLIELGLIEDVRISTSEEDNEGTLLSEFKDISPEQLSKIVELQKDKRDKNIEDNYISKDNLSEDQLRIINIVKEGGDLKQIFNSEQQLKRPFEGLDLEDEKIQKQVILHHFINNQNLSQKEALTLLAQKEKDFEVDSFSKQIVEAYNKSYDKYLTDKEEELKQDNLKKKQELQERKKSLTKTLKDNKLKDSIVRKVIDGVTKPISGNKVQIHQVFEEILKNPEENYEVLLHILDKKSYNELYKIRQRTDQVKNVIKLVDALPKSKAKKTKQTTKEENLTDFEKEILNINL